MNRIQVLENVFSREDIDGLRRKALETFSSVRADYFSCLTEDAFRGIYQDINTVARSISLRFFDETCKREILGRLLPEMTEITMGFNHLLCPLSTLRWYHPGLFISRKHEQAFLQTEPHYDNAFGNRGISIWLPLEAIDDETGGLCDFADEEILRGFPMGGQNRFNLERYLDQAGSIDPLLIKTARQPKAPVGSVWIHSRTLHGATKPKSKSRMSFNFRLIPETEFGNKPKNIQELYRLANEALNVCNALNLSHLGDGQGAMHYLKGINVQSLSPYAQSWVKELLESGILMTKKLSLEHVHWSKEFEWILEKEPDLVGY